MMHIESAIVDFEKSLAQHTSQQGGVCVTFSVLSVEGCDFDQEASFLIKATGAFIKAPAAVQGLFLQSYFQTYKYSASSNQCTAF